MDPRNTLYFGLSGLGFSAGYRPSLPKCSISSWWECGVVATAGGGALVAESVWWPDPLHMRCGVVLIVIDVSIKG